MQESILTPIVPADYIDYDPPCLDIMYQQSINGWYFVNLGRFMGYKLNCSTLLNALNHINLDHVREEKKTSFAPHRTL